MRKLKTVMPSLKPSVEKMLRNANSLQRAYPKGWPDEEASARV